MKVVNVGIDIGSTTVKVVVEEKGKILFSKYQRHYSNTKKTLTELLNDVVKKVSNVSYRLVSTGSGAINISKHIGIKFVQEVIACKNAIKEYASKTDVAIELGGEDAKIIYFDNTIEQRMNGSCAGGTGAFLDQMAVLLNTDTEGFNELARDGETIYPIASRCGVFAKSDIQPLLNEGARKEDIALSVMQAVVNQTISGLACGRPIRGNVAFIGGPLNYLDSLQKRFVKTLNLKKEQIIIPKMGHLFVCRGAILENLDGKVFTAKQVKEKIEKLASFEEDESQSLQPLFRNKKEYQEFREKHEKEVVNYGSLENYKGDIFIGIDSGSTTAKLVAISKKAELLYSKYTSNKGTPVETIKQMLLELYDILPEGVTIRMAGSTGYGEMLVKTAFNLDVNEIETIAHYTAAKKFLKQVDSIIDIGGQDMKYIKIKDGSIDTIMLNEACSAGCGSFLETLSKSLDMSIEQFVQLAIESKAPVDLGSRCTVFMNSKIKQTQKEGRPLGDIFAGLSYSVIKNAISKVMKIRDIDSLGKNIVVQGGTFLNDAVLRAFEILTGKNAVRPNIAGLMGAYGVALIAKETYEQCEDQEIKTTMLSKVELENLSMKTTHTRCQRCENHCGLTINSFDGKLFVSGNRCERGSGNLVKKVDLPNMYDYKYKRLFSYDSLPKTKARRGVIGIPRVLNMYENYPFFHTLFTELGFSVVLSDDSNRNLYEKGIESMPSESVCYPAKLVHGHIENLISKGIGTIFYPCLIYQNKEFETSDNEYNCPIVTSYPEAIKLNVENLKDKKIKYINSFLPMDGDKLAKILYDLPEFKEYKFTKSELKSAIRKAKEEQNQYRLDVIKKGREYLDYINEHQLKAIVLAGRPYHLDKEINHGIDTMITSLGLAVLSEDSICYDSKIASHLRVVDQWTFHSRVYRAADVVCQHPNLELVNLNSFGCGLDAIVTDQAEEILRKNGRLYTTIKIDEINNLGAAKIRIRSLIASMNKRRNEIEYQPYDFKKNMFQEEMKDDYTILCPDMSPYHMRLVARAVASAGYKVVYLDKTDDEAVENGLKYVNNDACYPSIIVIGQLITALKSGKYDLNNTGVVISQTGGGCRASNYIGLIRKTLKDAGFENVPIISFNFSGLEKEQGFKISLSTARRLIVAVLYGDLMMNLLFQTRPYEVNKGESEALYKKWEKRCLEKVDTADLSNFKKIVKEMIEDFSKIKVEEKVIPKVGVVGEILIKYHTYGNNNLFKQLEEEGAEVTVPELIGFVKYCCYDGVAKHDLLKEGAVTKFGSNLVLKYIDVYEEAIRKAMKGTRYHGFSLMKDLIENVDGIISLGNQTGEGWLLTAEMIELIKEGIYNIVCVQPFACLPNHIVGKSTIKEIKRLYPESNIVAIDYDPGASKTNQTNRIKLMLAVANDAIKGRNREKNK